MVLPGMWEKVVTLDRAASVNLFDVAKVAMAAQGEDAQTRTDD